MVLPIQHNFTALGAFWHAARLAIRRFLG